MTEWQLRILARSAGPMEVLTLCDPVSSCLPPILETYTSFSRSPWSPDSGEFEHGPFLFVYVF